MSKIESSTQSEKIVLSLMAQHEECIREALSKGMNSRHIRDKMLRYLFEIICQYYENHQSILTKDVLEDSFKEGGRSSEEIAVITSRYESLVDKQVSVSDLSYHISKLVDLTTEEDILATIKDTVKILKTKDADRISQAAESILHGALKLSTARDAKSVITSRDFVDDYDIIERDIVNRNMYPEKYRGACCYIEEIDKVIGGFQKGQLTLFCGETGGGKTTTMMNVAHGIYRPRKTPGMNNGEWKQIQYTGGKNVLYINLEVPEDMYGLKQTSMDARVPFSSLKEGVLTERRKDAIISARDYRRKLHSRFRTIHIVQTSRITTAQLEAEIKAIYPFFKPDVICVDYIDLMNPNDMDKDRRRQLGNLCAELRALGKKYDSAVITVAQIKREAIERILKGKDADMHLTDIGESAMIANTCDHAFGLLQDREADDKLWIFSLKNRYGRKPPKFHLVWIKSENWIGTSGTLLHRLESHNISKEEKDEFMDLKREIVNKTHEEMIQEEEDIIQHERDNMSVEAKAILSSPDMFGFDEEEDGFLVDDADLDAAFSQSKIEIDMMQEEEEKDDEEEEFIPTQTESNLSEEEQSQIDAILSDMDSDKGESAGSKFTDAGRRADW
jgi:replicative DNA helicase